MARSLRTPERVQALVAEILAEEAAQGLAAERENINDIENEMIRIGDMVAQEFGRRKLEAHMQRPPENPCCPRCGHSGQACGERTRQVITSRGEIPVTETKHRCPKCRRLFFPSDHRFGD